MKTKISLLLGVALLCGTLQAQTTRTINTQEYDAIEAKGSMTVILKQGEEGAIQVIAEEKAQEYVEIDSDGTTLSISLKKNLYKISKKGVKVIVPFTDIKKVALKGSGDIKADDNIETSDLQVTLSGSGDINLTVQAINVDSSLNGSGDINLSGITTNLDVSMTGSGDFDALELSTENTEAKLSGSGDIEVNATKSLNAVVRGSGDIQYSGNPEVKNTKVYGSGDIDPRN